MENAISEFVKTQVKQDKYFDSHAAIQYIMQKYPNLYVRNSGDNDSVATYHGRIAQKLSILEKDGVIEKIGDKASVSKNIKDEFSECALWRKK